MNTLVNRLNNNVEQKLTELYKTGEIKAGKELSNKIAEITGEEFELNYEVEPAFNFLRLDKKTVFCHLNPGKNPNIEKSRKKRKRYSSAKRYIESYLKTSEEYPKKTFLVDENFNNFDYKQALFLKGFPDNGIDFFLGGLNEKKLQRKNCYNVLMQQTQLELIPYCSTKFSSIFQAKKQSVKLAIVVKDYIEELLDIIVSTQRKYVIFDSDQYTQILKAYANDDLKILQESERYQFDIKTTKKAYFSMYKLCWKDKIFFAGIAHSFARQDLSNAFTAMKKYGKLSSEKYREFQQKHTT